MFSHRPPRRQSFLVYPAPEAYNILILIGEVSAMHRPAMDDFQVYIAAIM
jgi:hypothetical protein